MNTSELLALTPGGVDDSLLSFDRLHLREDDLHAVRMRLYHSSGDGFYIFRGFISPEMVAHMRAIWTTVDPASSFKPYINNDGFYVGCPNYFVRYEDGSEIFYNFLFSPPLDEVTLETSLMVNLLRNRLSGRNAFEGIYGKQALNYRVTRNLNRTTWAAPHTDWMDYERRWEKGQYDPSRLQATLFLSNKGVDYGGTGFRFTTTGGRSLVFGDDVPVTAGDLVIWRYGNLHSIEDVATEPGQIGFLRMIFPIYDLPATRPADPAPETFLAKLARHGKALGMRVARRVLRGIA